MNLAALKALADGEISNAIVAATPGGIEAQERQGQANMASDFRTLPIEMDRKVAEALGFVFGEPVDDVFISVTAPEGWSIRPTDHSMHSDVIDASGVRRGSIFYKAAFYDRRASGHWLRRYEGGGFYGPDDVRLSRVTDLKTGVVLWEEGPFEESRDQWAADDRAVAWVKENYPDNSPLAYWGDK